MESQWKKEVEVFKKMEKIWKQKLRAKRCQEINENRRSLQLIKCEKKEITQEENQKCSK